MRVSACHTCGKPGRAVKALYSFRVIGVPFCSNRCAAKSRIKVGDMVVLDSGYRNDLNGTIFRVDRVDGEWAEGRVRGARVRFLHEEAAKVGSHRATKITLKRQVMNMRSK